MPGSRPGVLISKNYSNNTAAAECSKSANCRRPWRLERSHPSYGRKDEKDADRAAVILPRSPFLTNLNRRSRDNDCFFGIKYGVRIALQRRGNSSPHVQFDAITNEMRELASRILQESWRNRAVLAVLITTLETRHARPSHGG